MTVVTTPPTHDAEGNVIEYAAFSDAAPQMFELHFAGSDATDKGTLIRKAVLRTGTWLFTPSTDGLKKKPLKIVANGTSNPAEGTISLAELKANFDAQALPYVPITLSDGDREHPDSKAKLTRWGKGFIRNLEIEGDGENATLYADFDFTEPEVREMVQRGTIADVSCGIPFGVTRKRDGKQFGAVLEHVALTNSPFIDGLEPFAIAASDDAPVETFSLSQATAEPVADPAKVEDDDSPVVPAEVATEVEAPEVPTLTPEQITEHAERVLGLLGIFTVTGVEGETIVISNDTAQTAYTVPFTITSDSTNPVRLAEITGWTLKESVEKTPTATPAAPTPQLTELERAQHLRELRLSQHRNDTTGGAQMSIDIDALGVELSDEARSAIQSVINENADLRAKTRAKDADSRVAELGEAGFKNRPGFLKLYRDVMLSDDGGPAAVLLSDDGTQTRLTALEILDRAIDAIKGSEGKVEFSDQAIASGNDQAPPATAEGETQIPVEDRLAAARRDLGLEK